MTGFSATWLSLREPADRRARDAGLVARAAKFLAGRAETRIVDLGAGTGSTLRAVAPHLGPRQQWLLVDGDAALAEAGRAILTSWGRGAGLEAVARGEALLLFDDSRRIEVRWQRADLAEDPLPVAGAVDLVTASALFDLVSLAFVRRLAAMVAVRGAALYSALDVDGMDEWLPPHPADADMAAAFRADQHRNKGFGPALGPRATVTLAESFGELGYRIATAESPWRLGADDAALVAALADGWAAACSRVPTEIVADWRAARTEPDVRCTIGHHDFWAEPGG